MTQTTEQNLAEFDWQPQPQAQAWLETVIADGLERCPAADALARQMRDQTGTRFQDWIDHLALPVSEVSEEELETLGFTPGPRSESESDAKVFAHAGGMFPRVILHGQPGRRIALKVEQVSDFVEAHGLLGNVEGEVGATLRRVRAFEGDGVELWAIERRGGDGLMTPAAHAPSPAAIQKHQDAFIRRQRHFEDDLAGYDYTANLIDRAVAALGTDAACQAFFAAERRYWQRRNTAAQIQKARQDRLGLGWANHDHHTYRGARPTFSRLVGLLEKLGLVCRERFYAGREAGWGAQVMSQPRTGIVVFADVDLTPDEIQGDFAHDPLPPHREPGTVGLWCALHGDSLLEAGMHHLECQFAFDRSIEQLAHVGIQSMAPFTDLPVLRQAFTQGETWTVDPDRVEKLRAAGQITDAQARQFLSHGAVGSHLEILERSQGYMGFNQTGVNDIISRTDPRLGGQ